jgi:hypothetical protein
VSDAYDNRRPPSCEMERQIAVMVCRLNCYRHPLDGVESQDKDATRDAWAALNKLLPDEVFLWMWNEGRPQWDPRDADTSSAPTSGTP